VELGGGRVQVEGHGGPDEKALGPREGCRGGGAARTVEQAPADQTRLEEIVHQQLRTPPAPLEVGEQARPGQLRVEGGEPLVDQRPVPERQGCELAELEVPGISPLVQLEGPHHVDDVPGLVPVRRPQPARVQVAAQGRGAAEAQAGLAMAEAAQPLEEPAPPSAPPGPAVGTHHGLGIPRGALPGRGCHRP